jgi:hypothetical protein
MFNDGKEMHLVFSGNDDFSVRKATVKLGGRTIAARRLKPLQKSAHVSRPDVSAFTCLGKKLGQLAGSQAGTVIIYQKGINEKTGIINLMR